MSVVRGAAPVAVALAVVAVLTAILWYAKLAGIGPHHPVFVYLLPIALLALVFGGAPAVLSTIVATLCGAFFLYEPIYSFNIANALEWGDLICFVVLALIGVKCTVELSRPGARIPVTPSGHERPWVGTAVKTARPVDPIP
jgi:K+-sensing histidine kinase KdpD